jgi:two-component system sensor histidine kinase KdpD
MRKIFATSAPNEPRILLAVKDWLLVVLLLSAATICAHFLDHYVSITSQAMLYVLAVVIASYTLSWVKSVVCAFAAVLALNFFFVPPRWTFQVAGSEHFIALTTMLVVALVINRLAT